MTKEESLIRKTLTRQSGKVRLKHSFLQHIHSAGGDVWIATQQGSRALALAASGIIFIAFVGLSLVSHLSLRLVNVQLKCRIVKATYTFLWVNRQWLPHLYVSDPLQHCRRILLLPQ